MVQINFAQKTVTVKIVYYGPGMSGKTTNLEVVHQRAPDSNRGDLTSIATDGDRTLFFDFMPLDLGTVAGMRTQFQIYTVPGQVYYNSTRKLVLQGVDGVIFIADSSASMLEENLESLRNLEENLEEYGKSLATIPHVIQYNKRDLPDAMTVEDLEAAMNRFEAPSFEAIASSGQGVFPTLKALAARVLDSIHSQQQGGAAAGRSAEAAPAKGTPAVKAATGFYPAASVPTAPAATSYSEPFGSPASRQPMPSVPEGSTGFYNVQASGHGRPQGQPMGTPPALPPLPPMPSAPQMPSPASHQPQGHPQYGQPMQHPQYGQPQQGHPQHGHPPQHQQGHPQQQGGWDMGQTQVHAPPTLTHQEQPQHMQQNHGDLRMAPGQMSQPAGPGSIRPSLPLGNGAGPAAMMRPPSGPPQGAQPHSMPTHAAPPSGAPAPGGASRLKPRSTALPTPRNPARTRSAARTALFVTLALAAGVVLGSLVISAL